MSNDIPTYEDCPECDSKLTVYTNDEYCVDVQYGEAIKLVK